MLSSDIRMKPHKQSREKITRENSALVLWQPNTNHKFLIVDLPKQMLGKEVFGKMNASMKESSKAMNKPDGESAVLETIAAMPGPNRAMGERLHAIIKTSAPALSPKLWYGMPAYAKDGKVVCFFRSLQKFEERYMTLGFNDVANLDEGYMWPIAFALKELTATEEARIGALVKKAVS
jgi:hypothetical protein